MGRSCVFVGTFPPEKSWAGSLSPSIEIDNGVSSISTNASLSNANSAVEACCVEANWRGVDVLSKPIVSMGSPTDVSSEWMESRSASATGVFDIYIGGMLLGLIVKNCAWRIRGSMVMIKVSVRAFIGMCVSQIVITNLQLSR